MDIILEYFDVEYTSKNGVPKIKLTLLENKKVNKSPIFKKDGIPYSGSQIEYWINYLGEKEGRLVYNERKKLFSKNKLIEWYIKTFDPINKDELILYQKSIGKKVSNSLKLHYNSPAGIETRKKLKARSNKWKYKIGHMNSKRWKDNPEWVEAEMTRRHAAGHYISVSKKNKERMQYPEFVDRFTKACNEPARIDKISKAVKSMWEHARQFDRNKFYRMLGSQKNKNYSISGYQMNSIEFQIATILTELKYDWVYEKVIHSSDKSYVPDFIINDNIILECFGDYWHANPLYFKPTDTTHKTRMAADIWKYDQNKIKELEEDGYVVIVLWENEINNNVTKCKKIIKESYENTNRARK
ncbi:MAG: hypothetical protein H8E55_09795 [Pelagibacterales bacterium]|nr:hypothetical protein [Pelagibacterales bacterium]